MFNDLRNVKWDIIGRLWQIQCDKKVVAFSPINEIAMGVLMYRVFVNKA